MKPIALLIGAGVLIAGGVAFAATRSEDEDKPNPLGPPNATGDCTSASDVWQVTQDFMADPASTPTDLRDVAGGLDVLGDYCNEEARQMGKACAIALRARADLLEKNQQNGTAPPAVIDLPPAPFEIPGGTFYQGYGWCPQGSVLDMQTGLCSFQQVIFVPPNILNATITAGNRTGACCASCARGDECEEDCHD